MKKNYIILAILASVWAILEMQLGTLLHATKLPFVGLAMMAVGIFFQTTARYVTKMRGSALLVAVVVAFLKMLFVGGIAFATVVAIFIQSGLLELIYATASPSRLRMSLGGAAAVCYSLVHPFFTMPLFMGLTVFDAYDRVTGAGSMLLGLPADSGLIIIAVLFAIHFITGFIAGHFSYNAAAKLNSFGLTADSRQERK